MAHSGKYSKCRFSASQLVMESDHTDQYPDASSSGAGKVDGSHLNPHALGKFPAGPEESGETASFEVRTTSSSLYLAKG
jgi:hypothetical protein